MPFKRFVILFLFTSVLCKVSLFGQSYTISGFISNKESGEVLVGAYVFCPQTGAGSLTNNAGYYALTLPYGTKNIMYLAEGFVAKIDTTAVNRNKHINLSLRELTKNEPQLDPFSNSASNNVNQNNNDESEDESDEENAKVKKITIKNSAKIDSLIKLALARNIKIIDRVENGFLEIPGLQISNMPSLIGEVDVIRGLKFLPGVMPGTELTNGLYVRGGGQDQNLVLIDGAPIYNMNHLFGFYSVFNSDGINSINLTKSGYASKYGGRLSSITDITMKEGNSNQSSGLFSQSLIALRLELNGPLSKDGKTTFAFSGRRSWVDLLFRIFNTDTNKTIYTLYDFNIKVCHRFNEKSKLIFSLFNCRDRQYQSTTEFSNTVISNTTVKDEYDLRWGNVIGSVRWNKVINTKLFSSFSGSYSQYKNQLLYDINSTIDTGSGGKDNTEYNYKYYNIIRDFTAKADFDYNADRTNTLHFGTALTIRGFIPGTVNRKYTSNNVVVSDTNIGNTKALIGNEYAAYLEDELRVTNNFKVAAGSRLVYYKYQKSDFIFLEPRLSFNLRVRNIYAIKGSYTLMNQNLYSLENNTQSFPTDRWMPATSKTPPQRAQQVTLGISKPFNHHLELSVEGYYKILNKVLEVKEGATFGLIDKNIEDKLIIGKGWSYGVETFLHKKKGNLSGWMSYSLSWAKRNAAGINRGEDYYFQFDRRHYINLVVQQKMGSHRFLSVNMVFSSGNVQSVPLGKYRDINGNIVYDYTSKNNYRLPNTFRVDIGFKKIRKPRNRSDNGSERGYNISVYNLFNRSNPAYIYILDAGSTPPSTAANPTPGPLTQPTAYQKGFLGFIPGISFYNKF